MSLAKAEASHEGARRDLREASSPRRVSLDPVPTFEGPDGRLHRPRPQAGLLDLVDDPTSPRPRTDASRPALNYRDTPTCIDDTPHTYMGTAGPASRNAPQRAASKPARSPVPMCRAHLYDDSPGLYAAPESSEEMTLTV